MKIMTNIICKTAGIAGMSAVVYDAYARGKKQSARSQLNQSADSFESVIANKRTASSTNPSVIAIQEKISDLRAKNQITPLFSKVTGFFSGALNSAFENTLPIVFSSMAVAGKGKWAKTGVWGLGGCLLYTIAKEGFGLGKDNPMGV